MSERTHLVLAIVTDICDGDVTYPSCHKCCSKLFVDDLSNSQRYRCLKCGSDCCRQNVQYRYRLVLAVADGNVTGRVVVFGRTLDGFFGKTATDFHRSVSELGKSGYPAEAMLSDSLIKTFLGKYFYLGIKTSDTAIPIPPSLNDVLCGSASTNNNQSSLQAGYDTSHTLVYQMLHCNDGVYATVTDHMRFSVKALRQVRKGEALQPAEIDAELDTEPMISSRHSSDFTESHFENSSLSKTSMYSKQISVQFSFENNTPSFDSERVSVSTSLSAEHGKGSSHGGDMARSRPGDLACSFRFEGNVQSGHKNSFVDLCSPAMYEHPVTQKLNFTDVNETDIMDKYTGDNISRCSLPDADHSIIQVCQDVLDAIPFINEHVENKKFIAHDRTCQNNTNQCNATKAVGRINRTLSEDDIQRDPAALFYLPDSEGLSEFLDTFEENNELSESQCEDIISEAENCYSFKPSHMCDTEKTKPLIDNHIDDGNIEVDRASVCLTEPEHGSTSVISEFGEKQSILSESEDLEAFLNSYDEGIDFEELPNVLRMNEVSSRSEKVSTCITQNDECAELECNFEAFLDEETSNLTNNDIKHKEAFAFSNNKHNVFEDIPEATSDSHIVKMTGMKVKTKATSIDVSSEDDSGFSQNEETECKMELTVADCVSYQSKSKNRAPDKHLQLAYKANLSKYKANMNQRNQVRLTSHGTAESKMHFQEHSVIDSDTDFNEYHSKKTNKNYTVDLEMFFADISLEKDTVRKGEAIITETVDRPSRSQEEVHESQNVRPMFADVEDVQNDPVYAHTMKNLSEVNLLSDKQSPLNRANISSYVLGNKQMSGNVCSVASNDCSNGAGNTSETRNNHNIHEDADTIVNKHITGNICSVASTDCSDGAENTSETLKHHYVPKHVDTLENLLLDSSGDLFDDSGDWCLQSDLVLSMLNDCSVDGNELHVPTDADKESEGDVDEQIIAESQTVYSNSAEHDSNVKPEEVQESSPASVKSEAVVDKLIIAESQNSNSTEQDSYHDEDATCTSAGLKVKPAEMQEASPASVKHVQFDRRLQQVTSCQLIDVRMRLWESPVERLGRKSLLKSCLKTKGIVDMGTDSKFVEIYEVSKEGMVISSVNGNSCKSHCKTMIENTGSGSFVEMSFVGGSQDLFDSSPMSENNTSCQHWVSRSNDQYVDSETDTPDIFASKQFVLRTSEPHKGDSHMSPDLFSQEFCYENSPTTPEVRCKDTRKTHNSCSNLFSQDLFYENSPKVSEAECEDARKRNNSCSKTKMKPHCNLFKTIVTRKENNIFRFLVEDTPELTNIRKFPSFEKNKTLDLCKTASSSSPPTYRKVLAEITVNTQDSPDLFDSPDYVSGDEFDQGFMDVPDQSKDLVKKLFF